MNLESAVFNVSLFWMLTTPHEYVHAWVATRLGDDTPRRSADAQLAGGRQAQTCFSQRPFD